MQRYAGLVYVPPFPLKHTQRLQLQRIFFSALLLRDTTVKYYSFRLLYWSVVWRTNLLPNPFGNNDEKTQVIPRLKQQWQLKTIIIQVDIHSVQGSTIFIALPTHSIIHNACLRLFLILFLSAHFLVWYQTGFNNTWINQLPLLFIC
jgi:hypothetical protein